MVGLAGCGKSGPKTYPVALKLDIDGGSPSSLAGSTIEVMRENDPATRASGEIHADGTASVETLQAGVLYKGAIEGKYLVRIIPTDDDKEARRRAVQAMGTRYRRFETSGLTFQVPASGEVNLKLTAH
ncbi:hypothetical protein FRUB_09588 [Fimbriiglobus ruber]|uniref:Carboxypeptidase regulatory-like domain-containing protein n=1 Tax=Fimbriiglobus ruber TaxID=1908690 RepID=A0A225DBR9_9BACT|nr:hypothetical protein FRUB_09588 [Fimbriiglobus ruber]